MKTIKKNESIEWNNRRYKMPFDITYDVDSKGNPKIEVISNRFDSESKCRLPSFAVGVYDTIIGSEITEHYEIMQAGLDWFRKNFTNQYFVLLD